MKKNIFILVFLILGFWFGGFILFAQRINGYNFDNNTKTEAIVVLTGGRYRIAEALKLLDAKKAKKMFISGVGKEVSLENIAKKQKLKILPEYDITLGQEAKNTIGNAIESNLWLKKNNINSIRLVTSNYHVERSIVEFLGQNPDLIIIPHPVYSKHVSKKWWMTWHTFSLIFVEYNKFLYVYVRTKILL